MKISPAPLLLKITRICVVPFLSHLMGVKYQTTGLRLFCPDIFGTSEFIFWSLQYIFRTWPVEGIQMARLEQVSVQRSARDEKFVRVARGSNAVRQPTPTAAREEDRNFENHPGCGTGPSQVAVLAGPWPGGGRIDFAGRDRNGSSVITLCS